MDNAEEKSIGALPVDAEGRPKGERRLELDLLKVVAIVGMILCHAVYMLGAHHANYEQDIAYFVADYVFGCYFAVAHAFMFAMGVGIVFSHKNKPLDLLKRGVAIYIAAFVLNFFRYGIYALIDGLIEGQFAEETVYAIVVQDIFHFAGLALIVTGALKAIKLKEWHICLIGVILSVVGGFVAFLYNGHPVLNYILGHFIVTTEKDSTFAFLNWYLFVGFGLLFGKILKETKDRDKLYRIVLLVSAPIMIVYVTLTCVFGTFFLTKNGWYYAIGLPDAVGLLSIDMTLLAAFYYLCKKVPEKNLSVFVEMSRNLTPIYVAQWCLIGFVDSIFCYLFGVVIPYWAEYLFGVALIFITYWIAKGWRKIEKKFPKRGQERSETAIMNEGERYER